MQRDTALMKRERLEGQHEVAKTGTGHPYPVAALPAVRLVVAKRICRWCDSFMGYADDIPLLPTDKGTDVETSGMCDNCARTWLEDR